TTGTAQYPSATYSTNYDTAWDFLGESIGSAGITYADHVILVETSDGKVQDAVPFVRSALGAPPAAFLADLQSIQAAGLWLPADCGGSPCTHTTTPSAESISVEWGGLGSIVTGKSVARTSSTDTDTNADWAVGASTFGAPNF
ncbi:MAG TPA: hypothetical protein VEI94_00565, partial [Candidatus Bathyarchaeia archaeon]|nr:hypothetical protein [Candidatus Bathyarchaeia archaeon]